MNRERRERVRSKLRGIVRHAQPLRWLTMVSDLRLLHRPVVLTETQWHRLDMEAFNRGYITAKGEPDHSCLMRQVLQAWMDAHPLDEGEGWQGRIGDAVVADTVARQAVQEDMADGAAAQSG